MVFSEPGNLKSENSFIQFTASQVIVSLFGVWSNDASQYPLSSKLTCSGFIIYFYRLSLVWYSLQQVTYMYLSDWCINKTHTNLTPFLHRLQHTDTLRMRVIAIEWWWHRSILTYWVFIKGKRELFTRV